MRDLPTPFFLLPGEGGRVGGAVGYQGKKNIKKTIGLLGRDAPIPLGKLLLDEGNRIMGVVMWARFLLTNYMLSGNEENKSVSVNRRWELMASSDQRMDEGREGSEA